MSTEVSRSIPIGTPTLVATSSGGVRAPINYLAPMDEKPYNYTYTPPEGVPSTNRKTDKRIVEVHDGRPLIGQLKLDREGFEFHRYPSLVTDFYDYDEVRRVYYPECQRLVKAATGAARVVTFDHIVRNAARAKADKGVKLPAKGAHNDYTFFSGPKRVRDFFPDEADSLLNHRYAIINVWRPVAGPVLESPFAICDAQSIDPADFVASDLIYPHRRGETLAIRYNPAHRWYYFPYMQPDEAMLLKCYDSATDGRARMTAHTAFDDPTSAPDAPPRESIETRVFVFYDHAN
ncbi:MAG TPA: CmcJ/NvfI family oxidoreductase [Candidatus Binataceae bacterium]|nr:CmcJ/NvfI family oxidoreductase [Candidatus Binataceae bacterium]